VLDDYKFALLELKRHEVEVAEYSRGLRAPTNITKKTFDDITKYWEENRVPLKRSGADDVSIIKQLRTHFGAMTLAEAACWVPAIDSYKKTKAHLDPKTVANHLTLLRSLLLLAHELEWMPRVPAAPWSACSWHSSRDRPLAPDS
jgi:hypothetical protein